MNPNAPFPPSGMPQAGPGWGPYVQHDAWWQGGLHLLPLLLLVVLIGVIVWGVLRLSSTGALAIAGAGSRPGTPATPAGPPPRDEAHDQAVQELRVRYARGELDRTDFLERSADLGGGPQSPDVLADRTLPGEPPAPDQG
jgi:putative membrane protein